ncbi:MAG: hypothetical protein LKJ76_07870 [Lachnospiraceae bacterium]|jgi:hypothetical protein|nr:hypothetical protein [Lachnospiraceae bacterium]
MTSRQLIDNFYIYHRFTFYYLTVLILFLVQCRFLKSKHLSAMQTRIARIVSAVAVLMLSGYIMFRNSHTVADLSVYSSGRYVIELCLRECAGILLVCAVACAVVDLAAILFDKAARLSAAAASQEACPVRAAWPVRAAAALCALLSRCRWELVFFFICLFEMYRNTVGIGGVGGTWQSAWYAMDYSMGFGSRMLIGSFLKLIHPGYLTESFVTGFLCVVMLAMSVLLAFLFGRLVRRSDKSIRTAVIFLLLLFLVGPCSPEAVAIQYTRFDTFGILFALLSVWFGVTVLPRRPLAGNLCITFFSVCMVLTHQGNFFTFYPIVLCMLLTRAFRGKDAAGLPKVPGWDLRGLLALGANFLITAAAFACMQFYGTKVFRGSKLYGSVKALSKAITKGTDINIDTSADALRYEYFSDMGTTYRSTMYGLIKNEYGYNLPLIHTALTIVFTMPAIVILLWLWKNIWKRGRSAVLPGAGKRKLSLLLRNPVTWIFLGFLFILPEFALNVDWGRWFLAAGITWFACLFIVLACDLAGARSILVRPSQYIAAHPWLTAGVLVYTATLGKFHDLTWLPLTEDALNYFKLFIH